MDKQLQLSKCEREIGRQSGKEKGQRGIWACLLSPLLAGIGASFMAFTSLAARQSKSTEVKATCVGVGSVLGAWHSVSCLCPLPYDLLSVNKELKSIGLHFVFSVFICLSLALSFSIWLSLTLLCFSLCISLSLHSIFTAHWFHFCTQQFRNKISPRCKLKLQCNWLIHAYITSPVTHCPYYQDTAIAPRGSVHCFQLDFV